MVFSRLRRKIASTFNRPCAGEANIAVVESNSKTYNVSGKQKSLDNNHPTSKIETETSKPLVLKTYEQNINASGSKRVYCTASGNARQERKSREIRRSQRKSVEPVDKETRNSLQEEVREFRQRQRYLRASSSTDQSEEEEKENDTDEEMETKMESNDNNNNRSEDRDALTRMRQEEFSERKVSIDDRSKNFQVRRDISIRHTSSICRRSGTSSNLGDRMTVDDTPQQRRKVELKPVEPDIEISEIQIPNERTLKPYIFVYNECATRHWKWTHLPVLQKNEEKEPKWDEYWQPKQPSTVHFVVQNIKKSSCRAPNRKLHSISRVFNFFENTLENELDEKEVNSVEASMDLPPDKSIHAMTRIDGLPWRENVMDGSSPQRRNICMFQVELLVTGSELLATSDEQRLKTRNEKRKSAALSRRRSTFIAESSTDATTKFAGMEEDVPIEDPDQLGKGRVALLREQFKKTSEQIESSLMQNKLKGNRDQEKKIDHFGKVSLVFKGNGKFGTILKAGQTGAANEELMGFQGGPVEIVAMREFFVEVSLVYLFSEETLKELEIEGKSQGQKEVEELGMDAFGGNIVSKLIARYTDRGDDWMRNDSDNRKISDAESAEQKLKIEQSSKKRQEEDRMKHVWISRMRHFRDSISELLAAKFLPEVIVTVIPNSGEQQTVEKYVKDELNSLARKFSGLPQSWPDSNNVSVVLQKDYEGAIEKIVFN